MPHYQFPRAWCVVLSEFNQSDQNSLAPLRSKTTQVKPDAAAHPDADTGFEVNLISNCYWCFSLALAQRIATSSCDVFIAIYIRMMDGSSKGINYTKKWMTCLKLHFVKRQPKLTHNYASL